MSKKKLCKQPWLDVLRHAGPCGWCSQVRRGTGRVQDTMGDTGDRTGRILLPGRRNLASALLCLDGGRAVLLRKTAVGAHLQTGTHLQQGEAAIG